MTQEDRRKFLIKYLLGERNENISIPKDEDEQKSLLRGLLNVREPAPLSDEFLKIQDEYLKAVSDEKGAVDISALNPIKPDIYLWKGDITRLKCDAIVNAANSGMTGCYVPCHNCIDNCIHTFAGVQLRNACAEIMAKQGCLEPVGQAKITPAFNLPCKYVIHTVGPAIEGSLKREDEKMLYSCYCSCLEKAKENSLKSIAFCCISTGVFGFPNERAAEIAVEAVLNNKDDLEVIFNVFKETDEQIYNALLK